MKKFSRSFVSCFSVALLATLSSTVGCERPTPSAPTQVADTTDVPNAQNIPIDQAAQVTDFELVDQDGEPFSVADMQGKVWGVSFFFTSCPGLCVKLNNAVNEVRQDYADSDARFLSVTVDPDVDTPEALTSYAGHFGADLERWIFLSGERAELKRVAREVFKQPHSKSTHNDVVSLVDRQGRIRGYFHVTDQVEMKLMRAKLDELLGESDDAVPGSSES